MTTSKPRQAYVWVWLPGATEPIPAGVLRQGRAAVTFTYGRSYLDHPDAITLYFPELPLRPGPIQPQDGLRLAGCIRDGGPDAWGQRVILARRLGHLDAQTDLGQLSELAYLLESSSDRIGGLDFQASPETYIPRTESASLTQFHQAADLLEAGEPLTPTLDAALLRGTSIGGARPKVLLNDGSTGVIAKLSSITDPYPVVRAEAVAMDLARRVGLEVAGTRISSCLGKDVLLVDRFDRTNGPDQRRLVVSALTMLGLDEMFGRYATYPALAQVIRRRFTDPEATLKELFRRIVFNVCVGNIDDHARNHAAFWDGTQLTLTPAYDLCPQPRSGLQANQAMAFGAAGERASQLRLCRAAAGLYGLSSAAAQRIIDHQVTVIQEQWPDAADAARLTSQDRAWLWQRQILSPYIFQD